MEPSPRTHRLAQVAVGYGDGARAVLAIAAWTGAAFTARWALDGMPTLWNRAAGIGWLAGVLIGWGVLMWATARIGRALGGDPISRTGMVVGSLVPLTSPFFALVLLVEARNVVRAAGFRMPAWGFRREYSLRLLPHECCSKCLYDLTGITTNVCPECGQAQVRRS